MHDGPKSCDGSKWSSQHSHRPAPFLRAVIETLLHNPDIPELLLAAHPDLSHDDVQAFLSYVQALITGEDVFPKPPKGAHTMPKALKNTREEKKKSTMTPQESKRRSAPRRHPES